MQYLPRHHLRAQSKFNEALNNVLDWMNEELSRSNVSRSELMCRVLRRNFPQWRTALTQPETPVAPADSDPPLPDTSTAAVLQKLPPSAMKLSIDKDLVFGYIRNAPEYVAMPLAIEPSVKAVALRADCAHFFSSKRWPVQLSFITDAGAEYPVIFKRGDDLRQDQLVLQLITLMDELLRAASLDLRLSPYRVLPTTPRDGYMQYVRALQVKEVLDLHGSILAYLQKQAGNADPSAPLGVVPVVLDNYVRSCAGYSAITYILGIGDRHMQNLLLRPDGRLLHIDFGFILGRDPKPFMTPIRLTREMVDAMGGTQSEYFKEFKKLFHTCFLQLRKHANLFLNLFALMRDSNVPNIAEEPDRALQKLQERFHLTDTEEELVSRLHKLIDDSLGAFGATIAEKLHNFAQMYRGT